MRLKDSTLFFLFGLWMIGIWLSGCSTSTSSSETSLPATESLLFEDIAEQVGLVHQHRKPYLDEKLSNIMSWMASVGAAVAAEDFNNDGFVDLYFTNSKKGKPNYLYKNNGDGTFTDIAEAAGLSSANDDRGTSMDAVWGDVNNDGHPDLYLVRWGYDALYLNNGDETFIDVTGSVFTRRDGNSGTDWANGNSALFFDYDLDGRLDIYVGNYFREVDLWNLEHTNIMHDDFEQARNAGKNFLYRQQDDGTFVEVATELGVDDSGWTLSVGAADVNGDGLPDLYSADDFGPDQLFIGQPGGTFVNATEASIGFDTKKGMNIDFGDFNNDGWLDMYVTNITTAEYLQEGNMLWYNQGLGEDGQITFTDLSLETGTYDGGWGWGAKFFDYDNDTDLDIIAANGFISAGEGSYWYDLASWTVLGEKSDDATQWPAIGDRSFSGYEKEKVWRNDGLYSFVEVADNIGLSTDRDGRGIAVVDYDNDGDLDVVIANQDQKPQLFQNRLIDRSQDAPHWLLVDLVTDPSTPTNRDGVGTRITLQVGDRLLVRERDGGNSFAGQSDPRPHFGLGSADRIDLIEVRWPDGGHQYLENVAVNQILKVRQDPSQYSTESSLDLATPTLIASNEEPVETKPLPAPGEIERLLGDMENRLNQEFDRALASTYRLRAAEFEEHDRVVDFFENQIASTDDPVWRLELALALVDKIPTCGGVAAIICKGSLARQGIDELNQVVETHPESWLAFYSRGMNHLHWPRALRHSEDAARDLTRCIELQEQSEEPLPYYLRTYVALGQAHAKDGKYDEARQAWQRGLEFFPGAEELEKHLAIQNDEELLAFVQEERSLQQPINTDVSFYEARM